MTNSQATFPEQLRPLLVSTQLIISEIHECINAGGDWTNVQMALMGFALAVRDETIREIKVCLQKP